VAELREALAEERSAASAAAAHAAEEADRCVDAQEQLIEVRQERNVHARESEETRSKLVALEAAHAVLQREHAQLQANYGGVKKSLLEDREKLRAATNSQNLALQAKDEAVANAQKAVCQLSDELRTNTILHAEAEKHKLHAEELKAHLADRDQQMLHQGQRLTTLIAQHGALKADFAEANRQLSAANAELREKRPALENATNQLRELRAELQSTKEAKNSLHVAYKLLQTTHIAMRLEKKRVGVRMSLCSGAIPAGTVQ
jgi:chromosome segregation ATPase